MNIIALVDFKSFTLGKNDNDRRLDKVIRIFAENLSLAEIYKYLRKGLIKLNGKKAKPDARVYENDVLLVADFILTQNIQNETKNKNAKNLNKKHLGCAELENAVVFENQHILIINKGYDVSVHGKADSLDKKVAEYYKAHINEGSLSFKPGPLHRLDRKTTGLLCFSMSLEGARWFSENIKTHMIQKKYAAIVCGRLLEKELWTDEIKKNEGKRGFKTVMARELSDTESDDFKTAVTEVSPVAYGSYKNQSITLALFDIKTGRTHQIRSQSALHSHPLLGDSAYGGKRILSSDSKQDFYLTAIEICFPLENPLGLPPKIKLDLPNEFKNFLTSCSITNLEL